MLGNNPLAAFEVDDLVAELVSRLQPDPRVAALFVMSEVTADNKLAIITKAGGSATVGLPLLVTALFNAFQEQMPEKASTVGLN